MTGSHSSLNLPPDDSDFSFDDHTPATATSTKREVPPLSLSPKEKRRADDHTPPGLSNPFWNS